MAGEQWITAHQRVLLCVVITAVPAAAINSNADVTNNAALWRPRFATPAIVALDTATDRQFRAEVKASPVAHNWSASIANDLKTWPRRVVSATYSTIDNGTRPGWRVKFAIPAHASLELFNLTVSSSEGVGVPPQSVSVIPAFATNFYILHITDEQIVNKDHNTRTAVLIRVNIPANGSITVTVPSGQLPSSSLVQPAGRNRYRTSNKKSLIKT